MFMDPENHHGPSALRLQCLMNELVPCVCVWNKIPGMKVPDIIVSVNVKKWTMWEQWIMLYLGQNEDYSLGDGISETASGL